MKRLLHRTVAGLALVILAAAATGCAGTEEDIPFRPRAATRIVILTPVPTFPVVPPISQGATVAPQPSPGPSAHAPTPPSAEGIATAQVEIGEITPVPILENTPAPAEVGTATLPGQREGEETAPGTPTSQGGALGRQVFNTSCAPCHGMAGQGMGNFAALDGNEVVRGDPALVIQTILSGRGQMPSWRDELNNEQIAAVVSYIRSAWGNHAARVSADMVARQRQ